MVTDKKIVMGISHGGIKFKKVFSSETTEPISTKLC
jgi:hypothetical protein